MTDVKRWLTEEEIKWYGALEQIEPSYSKNLSDALKATLEALAACRALLEKHQFDSFGMGLHQCRECKAAPVWYSKDKYPPCKPDCAIATALQGGGE